MASRYIIYWVMSTYRIMISNPGYGHMVVIALVLATRQYSVHDCMLVKVRIMAVQYTVTITQLRVRLYFN
jgi:hypothetical protein